ncbi:MAG: biopolymer transporter ExbD [Acidobacteria bacterium]|nr:biopolymer transporter ExbD [Acidobacteriota bacterium]
MAIHVRNRIPAEIPTASMADIAFLLIIFFMLTSVYSSNFGLQYGLPKNEPLTEVQPLESIHVHILGPGQYTVDRRPATLPQIAGYIDMKLKQNPKKPVIVQTDPDVPYYATIEVLDVCKQLRVESVSIPTSSEIAMWNNFAGGIGGVTQ